MRSLNLGWGRFLNIFEILVLALLSHAGFAQTTLSPSSSIYVSPNGSGTSCSSRVPCSLEVGRSQARLRAPTISSDINIYLGGGVYELTSPIVLTSQDSGFGGYRMNYRAREGATPVISGGTRITNWSLFDKSKNIYSASVPAGFDTRDFFVNGTRVNRARYDFSTPNYYYGWPYGLTPQVDGYLIDLPDLDNFSSNVEFIQPYLWVQDRCPADSITPKTRFMEYANSTSFVPSTSPYPTQSEGYVADFDGDGKADIFYPEWDGHSATINFMVSSAGIGNAKLFATVPYYQYHQFAVGDFNGDGYADVLYGYWDSSWHWHNMVLLSNGSSFSAPQDWLPNVGTNQYTVGDLNHDGIADFVISGYWNGSWSHTRVFSNGSSFTPDWSTSWTSNEPSTAKFLMADVDGNGYPDLIATYTDANGLFHIDVTLNSSSGFQPTSTSYYARSIAPVSVLAGDFNGDKMADIAVMLKDATGNVQLQVALSTGSQFSAPVLWGSGVAHDENYLVGDFNGDGLADVSIYEPLKVVVRNSCLIGNGYVGTMRSGLQYMESSYQFLNQPGQWYLDKTQSQIYYIPRSGEDMTSVVAVAGRLPTLITNVDSAGNIQPLKNISFQGITFAYTTWLEPNTYGFLGLWGSLHQDPLRSYVWYTEIPSAVDLRAATNLTIENNQFVHLGGMGLEITGGSQNVVVARNGLMDISGDGLFLGDGHDASQSNPALQNTNFKIYYNFINQVAVQYQGSIGVEIGYVNAAAFLNNEISNLPYDGLAIGNSTLTSYGKNIYIRQNYIHDVMQVMNDGGAIYTSSAIPGSQIYGNFLEKIGAYQTCVFDPKVYEGYDGIYHDFGSQGFTDNNNVIRNYCGYWLAIQDAPGSPASDNNKINNTYIDVDRTACHQQLGAPSSACNNNPATPNTVVSNVYLLTNPPQNTASNVMANAGLPGTLKLTLRQNTLSAASNAFYK